MFPGRRLVDTTVWRFNQDNRATFSHKPGPTERSIFQKRQWVVSSRDKIWRCLWHGPERFAQHGLLEPKFETGTALKHVAAVQAAGKKHGRRGSGEVGRSGCQVVRLAVRNVGSSFLAPVLKCGPVCQQGLAPASEVQNGRARTLRESCTAGAFQTEPRTVQPTAPDCRPLRTPTRVRDSLTA